MRGKVISFNKNKGYGFITTDNGDDLFFHYSELVMDDFKNIDVDQLVEFDVEETDRGLRAIKIHKI